MPHPSRILGVVCTVAVILVSLPGNAGIADKDLPLVNGVKVRVVYSVVGVRDSANVATSFHCTSTERAGGKDIQLGIEVFHDSGSLANDVTVGDGVFAVTPGYTATLSTRNTNVFLEDALIGTGDVGQGSARIMADSKNLLCSAMLVDAVNDPPNSMVVLPVFRTTKQKGM